MHKALIVIHAHFYQPPRENAWTEEIERQESAAPYHNWNQRILAECYRPNSCARVVSVSGKIVHILNNYEWTSFNFGPTLLDWLEKADPLVYERILRADRNSLERWGSGNAIAQIYNHLIMPLANDRDRRTQIAWGMANFRRHFGREPEGMWLAETAADEPTVEALIEAGVRFTILAPHQAARIRPMGSGEWALVSGHTLDTSRAYRIYSKKYHPTGNPGAYLDVFFYNGSVAHAVSFGNLLSDSTHLCGALAEAARNWRHAAPFISIATDGEVYGHHRKFGDMTLAYAIHKGLADHGLELTNFGAYLKSHPPTHEVELNRGPQGLGESWSCAHGVGRWREDCGCHTGGKPEWDQKWRAPLRNALDELRDRLAILFEEEGGKSLIDPWRARDRYIQVVMDRTPQRIEEFFREEGLPGLDADRRAAALTLLEMQRNALLMYTSCAWFFADISGIETVQVLQYAKRAMQLANSLTSVDFERPFLERLEGAKSNIRRKKNGKMIFITDIKEKAVTPEKVVHHLAVMNLMEKSGNPFPRAFHVRQTDYERFDTAGSALLVGRVALEPRAIPVRSAYLYALVSQGGHQLHSFVMKEENGLTFRKLSDRISTAYHKGVRTAQLLLKRTFHTKPFNFKDLLPEYRRKFRDALIERTLEGAGLPCADAATRLKGLAAHLNHFDPGLAAGVKAAVLLGLSQKLKSILKRLESSPDDLAPFGDLKALFETARLYDLELDAAAVERTLSGLALGLARSIRDEASSEGCESAIKALRTALDLNLRLDLTEAQNALYDLARRVCLTGARATPTGTERDSEVTSCPLNHDRELTVSMMKLADMMGFELGGDSASLEIT